MEFYSSGNQSNKSNSEFYKVYDRNGRFLRTIDRSEEKSLTDEYLYGVTCFVINEKGEILMEVRADTELTPGKKDLVSGHVDGNEAPTQAIIRELKEEVGIKNIDSSQVMKLTSAAKPLGFESRGKIRRFFIDFYCLRTQKHHFTIQPEEVESLKWIPMETVFEMIKSGKTKFPMQGKNVNYESIFDKVRDVYLNKNPNVKKEIGE